MHKIDRSLPVTTLHTSQTSGMCALMEPLSFKLAPTSNRCKQPRSKVV
jgi:hypothetical protein